MPMIDLTGTTVIPSGLSPEMIRGDEDIRKFLMGFAYKKPTPPTKKETNMIYDFIEWKKEQEPFVDDKDFFKQKYDVDPHPLTMDIIKELYFIIKEMDAKEDA